MKKSYFILPIISALAFVGTFDLSSSSCMAGPAKEEAARKFEERLQQFPNEQVIIKELVKLKDNHHEIFGYRLLPHAEEVVIVFSSGYSFFDESKGIPLRNADFVGDIYDNFSLPILTYSINLEKSDPKAGDFLRTRFGDKLIQNAINPNIVYLALERAEFDELQNQNVDLALLNVRAPIIMNPQALGRCSLNQAVELIRIGKYKE